MSNDAARAQSSPQPSDHRRWRRYLADERAEREIYLDLAKRRTGDEREILLALADAELRHQNHWLALLGENIGKPARVDFNTRMLGFFARRFGSIFVLALIQRSESRSPYASDPTATKSMAADEQVHEEVVRGLAARGRNRLSGSFRAAVFGANDGLVSNLALIIGMAATGANGHIVLAAGVAGLLAGALSMGAGEFVSVRSQRELLNASRPTPLSSTVVPNLDVNSNELALVYRARGMTPERAEEHAREILLGKPCVHEEAPDTRTLMAVSDHLEIGTAWGAAISSFCFFASGALIPIVPFIFGVTGFAGIAVSAGLVGLALLGTGAAVGLLSGVSPMSRALRQLGIGYGAAAVTYVLGLLFGAAGA